MTASLPCRAAAILVGTALATAAPAADLPSLVGPAMGTTYRVTLAQPIPGLSPGEAHREIDAVLARIDRAASTWRDDSDAARFNRAAAGDWVEVAGDLIAILAIARTVHEESHGRFDVTAAPRARGPGDAAAPAIGMRLVETRAAAEGSAAAIRKLRDGVAIDLGGIGPGYAVDRIGERLLELGSTAHLVELGGEVRGWGRPIGGGSWRVLLRAAGAAPARVVELADGEAIAASSLRPGRSPIDPRTGLPVEGVARTVAARADSCARADAWAVAAVVLGLVPGADGVVTVPPAPSTPGAPPAARRAGP